MSADAITMAQVDVLGGAVDSGIQHTNRLPMPDEEARRLERAGAIAPPYPPHWLTALYEQSTALRPAVEALEANVEGHGHRFEPRVDLDEHEARKKVREALLFERVTRTGGLRALGRTQEIIMPTDLEVEARIEEIRARMLMERMRLEALFSACCPGSDFVRLRKQLRRDVEVTGNAYLGVRRDNAGDVAEFEYLPSVTMRLRPMIRDEGNGGVLYVPVQIPVRRTPITVEWATTHRAFRTFVQFGLSTNVFFKQFGDPRLVSSRTGKICNSEEELGTAAPATEVIHFKVDSGLYEYGVPRWIAASPVVTGLRASQEVNAVHFDNNAIPRMLFLVSGGTLKEGADKKLEAILSAHARGRENYGRAVILQATPMQGAGAAARVQIEAKPLKESIPDDGLFLNYGARCRDEVLSQFRLPKFITGQLEDVNRSTAREGLSFVEDQVFQPLRYDVDIEMNALLQSEGILFWRFVSNSPVSRDPETSARIIKDGALAGGATVNDVRRVLSDIYNTPHPPIDEPWANLPIELAKLSFSPPVGTPVSAVTSSSGGGGGGGAGPTAKAAPVRLVSSPAELVDYLVAARDALTRGAAESFAAEFHGPDGATLVLPMTGDALAELVDVA